MREGWEVKKLGKVCKTGAGGTPLKSHKDCYEGGTIPWLLSGEVSQGEIFETKHFITKKGLDNSSAKLFPKNTVLVAMYGATAGQVGILRIEASTNQAVCGIFPSDKFFPEYLFYCFLNKKEELISQAIGNAQPNISQEKIRNTEIPIPPLPEQKRIIAILDKVFSAIDKAKANTEKNIQNSKEIFERGLNHAILENDCLCKMKKLSEIAEYFNGLTYSPKNVADEGTIVLRSSNIQNDELDFSDIVRVNVKIKDKIFVRSGDILMCSRNGSKRLVGKTATINSLPEEMTFGTFMMIIRSQYNSFLSWFFKTEVFRRQIRVGENTMINQITRYMLDDIIISVPPLEKQNEIVKRLDSLSKEIKKIRAFYQRKLNNLEGLKRSILQKAFSGELTSEVHLPKVIALPPEKLSIASTDLQAAIISIALQRHIKKSKENTFHHVKAEKIVNMVQYHLQVRLGRKPVKDAAGPNDFPYAKKVESRAAKAGFFTVRKTNGVYHYSLGRQAEKLIDKLKTALPEKYNAIVKLIDLIVPMNTQQAELVATVYAAWNNLLIDNINPNDEAIVYEARENWHRDKLNIPRDKFFKALDWMKQKQIIPEGIGGKVLSKSA